MTCFLWRSKVTRSQCGGSNSAWFQDGDEIDLVIEWVVAIDLFPVGWPKTACFYDEREYWLGFWVGGPNWFDFSGGDRIWLDLTVGMKLISLLCGWSKLTRVRTRGKAHLFSVWTSKLTWILCGWSKLTWYQCGGWRMTWFQCRMKLIWLCGLPKMTSFQFGESALIWFLGSGRKLLVFGVRIEFTWLLCRGIGIDLVLKWRSKLPSLQWWGRNSLGFYVRDRNCIGFSVEIELDCFFVRGSKFTVHGLN